tara:strand:+ start:1787 stop:2203 length:417 start_codon:yes stop_codon:yes gene_type:complete
MKKKLLFLCTGNSCRSQMAEGLGKKYLDNYIVRSAGTCPEEVNSNAINSMKEIGIDISNNKSKKIDMDKLNNFDLVITLCGDAKDKCPVINLDKHIHWNISDPAKFKGSFEKVRLKYSEIRNIIYNNIKLLKDKLNNN